MGQDDGAVGKPAPPLGINADHERRWVMPAGQGAQLLQADRGIAGVEEAVTVDGKVGSKNLCNRLDDVSIDGVFARAVGGLYACPKALAAMAEQDQLAEIAGVTQGLFDFLRQAVEGENMLPI